MSDSLLSKTISKAVIEGNEPLYIKEISDYGQLLERRNLPVIYTTHHLAQLIGLPYTVIKDMVGNTEEYYSYYKLKKKTEGFRHIAAPNQQLKYVQRWILINIIERIDPHSAAQGFRKNYSIKSNAEYHTDKEIILNVDLYRFFDTIDEKRVFGLFKWMGYEKNVSWDLSKLLTLKMKQSYWTEVSNENVFTEKHLLLKVRSLPQGAPTSPALANLVAYSLDVALNKLAIKKDLVYTRYADDLTFSGARNSIKSLGVFKSIIVSQGFYVNEKKVGMFSQKNRQSVTGITVNKKVAISRDWKNNLRNELYFCVEKGVYNHLNWISNKTGQQIKDNYKDHLYGKLCFLMDIEPHVGKKYLELYNKIEWPV